MAYAELLKVILTLIILIYASRLDWKFREIDNKSWVSLLALGVFFLISGPGQLKAFAASLAAAAVVVFVTYLLGLAAVLFALPLPLYYFSRNLMREKSIRCSWDIRWGNTRLCLRMDSS